MKRFLLLIFMLCFIATLFLICGTTGEDPGKSTGNEAKNQNVIYFAVCKPLTDDEALGGQQEALGVRYANSVCPTVDINGVTYDIKLLEQNNMIGSNSDIDIAQSLAKSKVTAVLDSYGSGISTEGEEILDKAGIPVIGISNTSPLLTKDSKNYFRICYSDTFQSGVIANFAYGLNYRNAAILTQTGDVFSKNAGKIITEEFSKLGAQATSLNYQKGQENFRSLTDEIKESGADCVVMASAPEEAAYFIKQARELGLSCPIIGLESWDSALLLDKSSSYFSNVYLTSEFDESSTTDYSSEFVSNYSSWLSDDKERIEENSGIDYVSPASALAYDSYMLVVEAIKTSSSSDSKAVMEAIRSISYTGVTGNITFNESGESGKELAYIKKLSVKNKQFEVLQTNSVGK